ncbi:MAG: phosphatase PAP2 family protein [Saprospiraceae bacterium]|nr:phosphatase PAP2 family protein [Saprospiraceae bacterium]
MDFLLGIDEFLFTFINKSLSSAVLDSILIPIRHKLVWIPLYLSILVFVYLNFKKSKWLIFLFFGITIVFSDTISSKLIKNSVKRVRPCHVETLQANHKIPCSYGFSFTSSHATNHFAIGTFLFFLFSFTKKRKWFLVWASIISFAQVYVGVHYPFDVLIGGIIGCFIGLTTYHFFELALGKFINQTEYVT